MTATPADVERVAAPGRCPRGAKKPALPDGSLMTVERLQPAGSDFGMKPSFERIKIGLSTTRLLMATVR